MLKSSSIKLTLVCYSLITDDVKIWAKKWHTSCRRVWLFFCRTRKKARGKEYDGRQKPYLSLPLASIIYDATLPSFSLIFVFDERWRGVKMLSLGLPEGCCNKQSFP